MRMTVSAMTSWGKFTLIGALFDLAERHFQRALSLNPNRSTLMGSFGWACGYLGKPEKGITYLENARLIDPYFEPSWYWRVRGVVHFIARQYEEAVAALGRSKNRRSIRTLVYPGGQFGTTGSSCRSAWNAKKRRSMLRQIFH